jgi:peptidoglycan/LPS O-acetylase OafA/YrhL
LKTKLPYRSEIDGLRSIAVLSVIIYHAQIVEFGHSFFKGGFVGVDIFFVISGYLISRILLSELFEKGKISFLHFYERRARRILPILFTVFLASFPLAYNYLMPQQLIEYAESILSATFFGSNIFFYFTNTQYGAEDSLLQPFLHTWSLGVEEQFYILFPIVLLLAYKFVKNHLVTIIAVLVLISLQYADWQSIKNTQLNFFMLTSRLWELGIGSLLAFYELKHGRVKHELLNQTMPLLGLAMITHSIIFFNNQTPHPSLITLLPTLGTALIILYSLNTTDLVGKVLSWKPIVGVGLISYSMYLWHYPLFAFARIGDTNGLHNDEKYLLILLTLVLSVISYFLIEKPFRNKQFLNGKKFSVIILILLITLLGASLRAFDTNGYINRYGSYKNYNWNNDELADSSWSLIKINHSNDAFFDKTKKMILILGNSHSKDLFNGMYMNEQIKSKYILKTFVTESLRKNKNAQRVFNRKLNEKIFESDYYLHADLIILSVKLYDQQRLKEVEKLFKKIKKDGKKLLVMSNKMEFKIDSKTLSITDVLLKNKFKLTSDLNKESFMYINSNNALNNTLQALAKKYNFIFFDTRSIVCNQVEKECTVIDENFDKYYYDFSHWTLKGSSFYVNKMVNHGFLTTLQSALESKVR